MLNIIDIIKSRSLSIFTDFNGNSSHIGMHRVTALENQEFKLFFKIALSHNHLCSQNIAIKGAEVKPDFTPGPRKVDCHFKLLAAKKSEVLANWIVRKSRRPSKAHSLQMTAKVEDREGRQ